MIAMAWRLARRELRGGLRAFRVFLACLAIGVGAIAGVGSVTEAIKAGLAADGRELLGGDAEWRLTHRLATADELAFLDEETEALSRVVNFRGMVGAPDGERALAQIKAIDAAYPLIGTAVLASGDQFHSALAARDGVFGAVAEQALLDRLALEIGDELKLGTTSLILRDVLTEEPDREASGIELGPRLMLAFPALEGSGLLQPGSLYRSSYRLILPEGADPNALESRVKEAFPDAGGRWRDLDDPAPGVARTVERIGVFLVLVGLASLAVGGVGVSAATRGYLEKKTETIGTLKALGAKGGLIVWTYLIQIGVLTLLGVGIGLLIGAGIPLLFAGKLAEALPVPTAFGVYPRALGEAALYGVLTALVFALWPLALARETPAAVLFRDIVEARRGWPRPFYLALLALLAAALIGAAIWFAGNAMLGAAFLGGVAVALLGFALAALGIRWVARRLSRNRSLTQGRPTLRLALAAIGGPGGETAGVMLSLGMGLTLLSAIGQIDANLRSLVDRDIADEAPAFFFLDIPAQQRDGFVDAASAQDAVSRVETAPMLRGRITALNGIPANEAKIAPEARWMLNGDRGLTYATAAPDGSRITAGEWWPPDYRGEPLVSFIEEEGRQMGLDIGDTISVNVLGRDMTARIASFREVEWRRMGINFTMIFSPDPLRHAPHSHIATVYADLGSEGRLTRVLASDFPSAVAIPVREIIEKTSELLGNLANGVRGASLATLLSGLVVLIGATAAGQARMIHESAILKTLGATRGGLMRAFALRYLLLGVVAAGLALALGSLAAWAVVRFVFETGFTLHLGTAALVSALGIAATLLTGLLFAWQALAAKPAKLLRARG